MHGNADKEALTAALAEEARSGAGEHPEPEVLLDYRAGALDPEAEERVRGHLVACRECGERLLELAALARSEPPADGVADLQMAASWREMRARIAAEEAARRRPLRLAGVLRLAPAAAAVFFLTTVGLSFRVARLQPIVAELRAPQANVPILYLDSKTEARGPADTDFELPIGHDSFLIFIPEDFIEADGTGETFPEYELAFLAVDGRPVLVQRELEVQDSGALRLRLSRSHLPAGTYRIQIYGLEDGERELLKTIDRVTIRDR